MQAIPQTGDYIQASIMFFLVNYALPVLLTAAGTLAVAVGYEARKWIKVKLGADKYAEVVAIVDQVVKAVEQTGLKQNLELTGQEKLDTAVEEAQRILRERGLGGVDVATLVTTIEAALRDGVHKGNDQYALEAAPIDWSQLAKFDLGTRDQTLEQQPNGSLKVVADGYMSPDGRFAQFVDSQDTDLKAPRPAAPLDTH